MKLFNRKPKIISRNKLKQFPVAELIEYQECLYQGVYNNETIKDNTFNNYLLKHNLLVMEEQLDEVIDELLIEYKNDLERIWNNVQ